MASLISCGCCCLCRACSGFWPCGVESVRASQDVALDLDPASVFMGGLASRLYGERQFGKIVSPL